MDNDQAERVIRLLEEIRDGQQGQLDNYANLRQRTDAMMEEQRERAGRIARQNDEFARGSRTASRG